MKRHPQEMTAAAMERLLKGGPVDNRPGFDELAAYLRGVKARMASSPSEELRSVHLSQISALLDRTRPQAVAVRHGLLTRIYDRTLGTLRRRAYALSTAMVIATGSLAAAGALPDAAQNALSDAAERVGFSLPAAEDDPTTTSPGGDAATLPEQASEVAAAVHEVIDDRAAYGNGHDFGQAVAQAAREANGSLEAGAPDDAGAQADDRKQAAAKGRDGAATGGRPDDAGRPEVTGRERGGSKAGEARD